MSLRLQSASLGSLTVRSGGSSSVDKQSSGDNSAAIASTSYVYDAVLPKAPLASPSLTGTPSAPTASSGTNTTQIATTAFVRGEVADLVAAAPGALDTLNELAAALGNDASFSATVTTSLSGKAPLASPALTGAPTAPTVVSASDSSTKISTTAFVQAVVAAQDFSGYAAISAASASISFVANDTAVDSSSAQSVLCRRSGSEVMVTVPKFTITLADSVGTAVVGDVAIASTYRPTIAQSVIIKWLTPANSVVDLVEATLSTSGVISFALAFGGGTFTQYVSAQGPAGAIAFSFAV
jgi:hypothetical protein